MYLQSDFEWIPEFHVRTFSCFINTVLLVQKDPTILLHWAKEVQKVEDKVLKRFSMIVADIDL